MGKSQADEKILSYNDVVLRRSDLDILSGPYYLNDRIIEFYFSYLSSCHPSQDILLVPPSIAFWIIKCPVTETLRDFLEPLHLSDKTLVIFPINDNDDVDKAEGGSHWSLLAYYRNANLFVHHDSCRSMNTAPAKQLYRAVVGHMGVSGSASEAIFLECTDSPIQENGYDCGLYVTAIARRICNWHVNHKNTDPNDLWFSAVKEQVTPSAVASMRSEILALIKDLMARH
ncbi:NEDD8-specific protease 1 isoform X2 [Abrus precatorius]|uniref:NEDD8-specific protease 1 isoform X1 n=1 Tax=Abrus precatorius TaxID=3816 RepID=A0A8B8KP59_ABRPR|nr:NEDD8-specific protease 1 isoform X1 [Abrus precatorius]XP_027345633.1 NEDD8-specific protease 1 isoform X2 [Abrus precatorius]